MKKTILALSVLLIVFAGFLFPNMSSANAQAEQVSEDVLRITEYETEEGTFKEVRNLQEYRQLLSEQGLSDHEVSVRMLKVSGYTQEQIDRMPEEAILQNLLAKDSKMQIIESTEPADTGGPEALISTMDVDTNKSVEGLNFFANYRTIELSIFADGRDPDEYLLISTGFDWKGNAIGMPESRSNDFIAIYNNHEGEIPGVTFKCNDEITFPEFGPFEVYSVVCSRTQGVIPAGQVNPSCGIVSTYEEEISRVFAFEIPKNDILGRNYFFISGYYQCLGKINKNVQDLQKIRVMYGHSYQEMQVDYTIGGSVGVKDSGFGFEVGGEVHLTPITKINSSRCVPINYLYTPVSLDGVYVIKNVSTSKPLEMYGNSSSLILQANTIFNENLESHRKNSYWQFKIEPIAATGGTEYTIKSIAYNRYLTGPIEDNGHGFKGGATRQYFRIFSNSYMGQDRPNQPYCKIVLSDDNCTKAITGESYNPMLYIRLTGENYNTSNWFLIPVAEEDIGSPQTGYNLTNNGVYKLKNVGTGKYVEIPDYNANIDIFAKPATASTQKTCQEFRLRISNGLVELCPNHLPYHRLDVQGGTNGSGIPIQQYYENNSNAQKFILQPEKLVNGIMRFRIYTFASELNGVLQCNTSNITQETYSASKTSQLWELVYQYTPEIDLET